MKERPRITYICQKVRLLEIDNTYVFTDRTSQRTTLDTDEDTFDDAKRSNENGLQVSKFNFKIFQFQFWFFCTNFVNLEIFSNSASHQNTLPHYRNFSTYVKLIVLTDLSEKIQKKYFLLGLEFMTCHFFPHDRNSVADTKKKLSPPKRGWSN